MSLGHYDVVIIGGGPAGSLCASLILRQDPGRRVLLLEKDQLPRHHVGEALIPGVGPILARAGILDELERRATAGGEGVLRKVGIVYWWGEENRESWSADFRDPLTGSPTAGSYHVDRALFDELLLSHASSLGAEVRQRATVEEVEEISGGSRVRFRDPDGAHEASADYLVDASGLSRALCKLWRIPRRGFDEMNNYALIGYFRGSRRMQYGAPLKENEYWTFIATARDGWIWHIPLGEELTSVGLVTSKDALPSGGIDAQRAFYLENVRGCHGVRELLSDADIVQHPHAHSDLMIARDWSSHAERLCGEKWFLIGDAAAFVDPILTSGVVLATIGASLAASALHTIWNDATVDHALLRTSYHETYLDLAAGYHRLASIWYRRNDKVRSWWWEGRRQALRSGASPSEALDDMRSFLGISLGLVRDPFAGRARERGHTIDLVRPDKLLFAHNLFPQSQAVEDALASTLVRLTEKDEGEIEARGRLYGQLVARWRTLLSSEVELDPCDVRRRSRYYTDRTMHRWERADFVECTRIGGDPQVDRIVLPGDTDPGAPLGLELSGTLRSSLERATEGMMPGSQAYKRGVQRVWEHAMQFDFRGWLRTGGASSDPDASSADALPALRAFVRTLTERDRVGVTVDLLGRYVELTFFDDIAGLQLVPLQWVGTNRTYDKTSTAGVNYIGRQLGERSREVHASVVAKLRRMEGKFPDSVQTVWSSLRRGAAGACEIILPEEAQPSMPEHLHPDSSASRYSARA